MRKLALANGVLLREKEEIWNSGLNDANDMVKQSRRAKTFCPSTIAEGAVTLHTETCKWTLSPCRQGHVVSLLTWLEAEVWQASFRVITI